MQAIAPKQETEKPPAPAAEAAFARLSLRAVTGLEIASVVASVLLTSWALIPLQPGARWENKRWPVEHFAATVQRLAAAQPGNTEWQRDLSVSFNKLGAVEVAAGNLAAARQRFEAGFAIRERLVEQWPDHPQFANDMAISRARLAGLG